MKQIAHKTRLLVIQGPRLLWCARAIGLTHHVIEAGDGYMIIGSYAKRKTRILVRFRLEPVDKINPQPVNAKRETTLFEKHDEACDFDPDDIPF